MGDVLEDFALEQAALGEALDALDDGLVERAVALAGAVLEPGVRQGLGGGGALRGVG